MGSILSKFCKCIFCCCPKKNCYGSRRREVENIYNGISQRDNCWSADVYV